MNLEKSKSNSIFRVTPHHKNRSLSLHYFSFFNIPGKKHITGKTQDVQNICKSNSTMSFTGKCYQSSPGIFLS